MSLAGKTLNGLKWSYIFTVINVITQLGLTILLARLLSPTDYGLITMGNVVLRFGSYFAQMGIAQSLIQGGQIDKKNVFTAYALTFILSMVFYLIIFSLAPLSLHVFSSPEVVRVTRVLAINIIFSSIATVSISLLRTNYKYRLLGIIDFIAFIIGNGIVAILMAALGFGVWSLVTAVLIQGFLQATLTFYFTRSYFGIKKINIESAKKLLGYGSRFTASTFLEVVTYSSDYLIIGHYLKERVLGIYNRATLLVHLPSQYISANLIKVLFPTLNEVKNDKERFIKYYQSVNFILGVVLFGVCLFISLNAEEIVNVLLGEKWKEGIPVLQIIALAVPFNLLINYNGLVYDVYGFLNSKMLLKVFHMLAMLTLFFIMKSGGLTGIAHAYLITEVIFYFIYNIISFRMLAIKQKAVIKAQLPFLYVSFYVLVVVTVWKVIGRFLNLTYETQLVITVIGTPILFLLLFLVYPPKSITQTVGKLIPAAVLNQNKPYNYLMKNKFFRRYWLAIYQPSGI